MIRTMVCALGAILFLSACGSDTSGTGGSTGGTGTGGATGGTGGVTGGTGGATGGTGGTGGVTGGTGGCAAPVDNVYDNATAEDLANNCIPIAPDPTLNEDGTFAVTLFGPFATPFTITGFTFGAHEAANTMITDPWTASVIVVPAGQDPTAVDPNEGAKAYDLVLLESMPVGNGKGNKYSVTLDVPLDVGACDSVVVSLRNTLGPPDSALEMCGLPSSHPETNLWWNKDGTMDVMADFAPGFDHNWWVSLVPAVK